MDKTAVKNRRKPSVSFRLYGVLAAVSSGARRVFSEKSTRQERLFGGEKRGREKVEKNFGSALYKGEVCVIITSRVAEVAELADALGSGPSPRNWGWRFESSLRHSFKSSFLRRTLFLFLDGEKKTTVARSAFVKKRRTERFLNGENALASTAPLFFRAGPDTMKTTILREVGFSRNKRRFWFYFCSRSLGEVANDVRGNRRRPGGGVFNDRF